jgi:hypothetical protein
MPLEETRLRWIDPAWRAGAERWIAVRLDDLGRTPVGAPEQPHFRPWGTVLPVSTESGPLWFKVLADAGTPLVYLHPERPPPPVWRELLTGYPQLQLDLASAAREPVAAGIPDRRSRLVDGFERVIEAERGAGSISGEEHARLRSLLPRLPEAVEVVAALALPGSLLEATCA